MVRPRSGPTLSLYAGVLLSSPLDRVRAVFPKSAYSISSVVMVRLTPYVGVKRKDITVLFEKMQVAITQKLRKNASCNNVFSFESLAVLRR
jgi:hypothetical protein